MKKRIMVHGRYNTSNFGDILLLDMVSKHIHRLGDHEVVSPWVRDEESRFLKSVRSSGLTDFQGLSLAVLGGGGYFNDSSKSPRKTIRLLRYLAPVLFWRITSVPYCIIGVGVGPELTPSGGRLVRFICKGAKIICVRDYASKAILVNHGVASARVAVAADLALCLSWSDIPKESQETARKLIKKSNRFKLGIHLSLPEGSESAIQEFSQHLKEGLKEPESIDVYWFFDHAETNILAVRQVVDMHDNYFLVCKQDHWTTAALIGNLDAVITTKLHVSIVAYALGVPPFGFSNHGKTRRFFDRIGRSNYQVENDGDFSILTAWLEELFSERSEARTLHEEVRMTVKNESLEAFTMLETMMEQCEAPGGRIP